MSHQPMRACHFTYAWHSCLDVNLELIPEGRMERERPCVGIVYR